MKVSEIFISLMKASLSEYAHQSKLNGIFARIRPSLARFCFMSDVIAEPG